MCRRAEATTSRRLVRRCARAPLERCAALRRTRCPRRSCGLRRLLHAGVDAAALPALPVALLQRLQLEGLDGQIGGEFSDQYARRSNSFADKSVGIKLVTDSISEINKPINETPGHLVLVHSNGILV
nr:uncharacterized protein LOC127314162 [Lolium perenne]